MEEEILKLWSEEYEMAEIAEILEIDEDEVYNVLYDNEMI